MLWHLGATGTLVSLDVLPIERDVGMMHDFVLTERHFLLPMTSLAIEAADLFAEKATRTVVRTVELPPGFVFHFGNRWEDASGTIRVDTCWYNDPSVLLSSMRAVMRGSFKAGTPTEARLLTVDIGIGRATSESLSTWSEFPRFDERYATRRSRQAFAVSSGNPWIETGASAGLLRFDRESGMQDRFSYGQDIMVEEHIFVPHDGSPEGVGWLVGTSLDTKAGRTRLAVFESTRLADGPIALATLPYALPLGLHGTWFGG